MAQIEPLNFEQPNNELSQIADLERKKLLRCLGQLTPEEQKIITWRYLDDLDFKEITKTIFFIIIMK